MWLTAGAAPPASCGAGQILLVDAPLPQLPFKYRKPAPGLHRVAGERGQQRAGAHDVAAGCLPLQPLSQPQQRRPLAVQAGRLFDERDRDTGERAQVREIACRDRRLHLFPAEHMRRDEVLIDETVATDHVKQRKRQRRVAAGKGLQMNIRLRSGRRTDRVDDDHLARRLGQPMLVSMRRRGMRIRAPHHDAGRILGGARIEAVDRRAVHIAQRHVARHVANRVRRHFGGAQSVEKSHRRHAGQSGDRARVMRIQYRVRTVRIDDAPESRGDFADRRVPGHRLEAALPLAAHAPQRPGQAPRRIAPFPVVGRRTLAAQRAAAHRVPRIAANRRDYSIAADHADSAAVVAVARDMRW